MRYLFISIVLLLNWQPLRSKDIPVNSEITEVNVYRTGASIHRQTELMIPKGSHRLIFEGLSPYLDLNSLTFSLPIGIRIHGISGELVAYKEGIYTSEDVNRLVKNITDLKKEIAFQKTDIEVTDAQIILITSNQNLSSQQGLDATRLKTMVDYYQSKLAELKHLKLSQNEKVFQLNKQLADLETQLQSIPGPLRTNKRTRVTIELSNDLNRSAQVMLSYFTHQVHWQTTYDINVSGLNAPIELIYKANLVNNSGENWNDISLRLSTAQFNRTSTLPTINPWRLRFREPYVMDGAEIMDLSIAANQRKKRSTPGQDPPMAVVEEQFTGLVFTLDHQQNVPADNQVHRIELLTQSTEATYRYHCVPYKSPYAYLVAEITDPHKLNLSQGAASIFFEGRYQGKSYLQPNQVGDRLLISLGTDIGISIERKRIEDYTKKKFIGSNKKEWVGYRIEIKNNKTLPIAIEVKDRFPLSTESDIAIDYIEWSDADFDKESGYLTWQLDLLPGQQKKLDLSFSVKYPKSKYLRL